MKTSSSSEGSWAVGVDFGGTSVKFGVVFDGHLVQTLDPIPTPQYRGPLPLIEAICGKVREAMLAFPQISAVGFGVPGMIDHDRGYVNTLTNVEGWNGVALRDLVSQRLNMPVSIDNDAKCMAYGEWRHGAGVGKRHLICLTLGTGVGSGLILDGRLYRGAQFAAGELGNLTVDWKGRPFKYGNSGCIEAYAGNHQIATRAVEAYAAAGVSKTLEDCTPAALDAAADAGDAIAAEIWQSTAEMLGVVLADVAWLLNPEMIVIGGGVAAAGPRLFSPIQATVRARTFKLINESLQIVPAKLGNHAGIIGSATMALDEKPGKMLSI